MKWKKVTAILMTAVMLGSVAACGSGGNEQNSPEESEEAGGDVSEETMEQASSDDVPTLTLFIDETWWPYDKWEGAVPEEFERRLGVNIEVTRAADDNQLPLMVASGDMPDIICSGKRQYLADSNVCYALDELQEQYPDIAFDVEPIYKFVNQAEDGHYYTIGCDFSPEYDYDKWEKRDMILAGGPGFMYRPDIAEELGLEFNTLADLDTAFAKVAEAYPDYTVVSFNCIHKFGWLMQQMGLKNGGFYENEDGKLEWWIRQDGLLDYFKKVNEWYRLGYIPAENFAYQSEDETKEVCVGGKVFSNFGFDNHADNFNTAIESNGDDFRFDLVTNELTDNPAQFDTTAAGRGLYISKSCENVELAYKVLSYAYSEEGMYLLLWGIEGEDYTLDADGFPVFNYDYQGDNSELQPRGLKYWGWMVCNAIASNLSEANSDSQTAVDRRNLAPYVKRNPVIGMIRYETDSDEANIEARLNEMIDNQQTNIYMAESEEECEAAFYEMLDLAEEIGMGTLEAYANKTYPDLKAQYDEIIAEAVSDEQ